ncbi:MAG TPA: hypothetical protein VFF30_06055 [Nitrososphaerales archaeon]|nr:hypothetical protein [Nitrososphaerales archaeon]
MAFDDPVVWILIIAVVIAVPVYLIFRVVSLLSKANKVLDNKLKEQEERKQKQQQT